MNNRQNGRRRGRNNNNSNNNRPQSGGRGGTDQANRIDSRARGNAAQMIEKFKNLARDAQLSGDRVQTEYYLQFADHYFRVHSDFRARQEEKNGGQHDRNDRREVRGVEDFDAHDETDLDERDDQDESRDDNRGERNDRNERNDRPERNERPERNDRPERAERNDRPDRNNRNERSDQGGRGDRPDRPRRESSDDDRGNRQPVRARPDRDPAPERAVPERAAADRAVPDRADVEPRAMSEAEEAKPAPRAARRSPRRPRDDDNNAGIDSAVLPPAIGRPAPAVAPAPAPAPEPVVDAVESDDVAPKPRKRRTLATRSAGVEAAE